MHRLIIRRPQANSSQSIDEFQKIVKAAASVARNIFPVVVYKTIGQKEHFKADIFGNHIVSHVVARHQTFVGAQIHMPQNFRIIFRIRLAVMRLLVRRYVIDVVQIDARKPQTVFLRYPRKNGICRNYNLISARLNCLYSRARLGIKPARRFKIIEIDAIKLVEVFFIG